MTREFVHRTTDGRVGVVTLGRPEARNALTAEMLTAMRDSVVALGQASGAVLIRGEGPVFCAGFDLAAGRASPDGEAMRTLLTGLDALIRAVRACPVPVVVAAHGAAIAGACALVAAADFAVTDRQARLGYPVVLLGLSPAVSVPTLLPAAGAGHGRRLTLNPGLVRGNEALRMGLVSDLVESPDEVGPAAKHLAESLASKPRGSITTTKAWLNTLDGTMTESDVGLSASLGLTGGAEERTLLEQFWSSRR